MKKSLIAVSIICSLASFIANSASIVEAQRANLAEATKDGTYGPQSPRDLSTREGQNIKYFGTAPNHKIMHLCNIHFHKGAEHKGGEFTTFIGEGKGDGNNTGYRYDGQLSVSESEDYKEKVCAGDGDGLVVGDTIETQFVFSTAGVKPGATLSACFAENTINPQLRVEGQVMVLTNDGQGYSFVDLTYFRLERGFYQAPNIPIDTGKPIQYAGSTTDPSYNEKASPLQVSWSVRPKVIKVDIGTVKEWCEDNVFDEDRAHGVRNLIINPNLLSPLQ
jgi:hypothetical protein